MKKVENYTQVKDVLGSTIANWWLVYIIGDIYVSNLNVEIEIWNMNCDDKVYYLPFILNRRLIKIKNV